MESTTHLLGIQYEYLLFTNSYQLLDFKRSCPYYFLFHVIELHKIWENPNGTAIFGKIITNEHIFLKSWLILIFSLLL